MNVLRQATTATIKLGPFVDATNGVTAEDALTITQAAVRLSKNGGNMAQKNEATSATHDELGYYDVPIDATDTSTCGTLRVMVSEAGALPVFRDFQIVEEAVYDALYAASAAGPLLASSTGSGLSAIPWNASWDAEVQSECQDAITASGLATSSAVGDVDTVVDAINAKLGTFADFGSGTTAGANLTDLATSNSSILVAFGTLDTKIDAVDVVVDAILVDTAVIGAAGAGLTAIPWNAAWDTEVQSECTDALNAYDPPTRGELTSDINNLDSSLSTTIGTATSGLATAAALATVDTVVDAILVDTAVIGAAGAGLTAIPWNASWDAEVQSECADAITAATVLKTGVPYDITTVNGTETATWATA